MLAEFPAPPLQAKTACAPSHRPFAGRARSYRRRAVLAEPPAPFHGRPCMADRLRGWRAVNRGFQFQRKLHHPAVRVCVQNDMLLDDVLAHMRQSGRWRPGNHMDHRAQCGLQTAHALRRRHFVLFDEESFGLARAGSVIDRPAHEAVPRKTHAPRQPVRARLRRPPQTAARTRAPLRARGSNQACSHRSAPQRLRHSWSGAFRRQSRLRRTTRSDGRVRH